MSRTLTACAALLLVLPLIAVGCSDDDEESPTPSGASRFGGGPVGGAFQGFAEALGGLVDAENGESTVEVVRTGGSAENLAKVESGELDHGIVYAGDLFLGKEGDLPGTDSAFPNVLPIAALYGGVVHLLVSEASGIETVADVAGKRIAPGNEGSGAALAAERYFTHLGLWDEMTISYVGYSEAAAAMTAGDLDGFWVLGAVPNEAITEADTGGEVRLVPTYTAGAEAGFFEAFPFYTERAVPGGTYEQVDADVESFQDTALWVVNAALADDEVEALLGALFSDAGLAGVRAAHPAGAEIRLATGLLGIRTPLHPGAFAFWEAQNVEIPEGLSGD